MNKPFAWTKTLLVPALLLLSLHSQAALIDRGSYVTDTDRNLDFLKLWNTNNYSWNAIVENDLLGFLADGWQVADQDTLSRVNSREFFELMRPTDTHIFMGVATNNARLGGQDLLPDEVLFDYMSDDCDVVYPDFGICYEFSIFLDTADFADENFAVALSRTTVVPAPGVVSLIGIALLGLAQARRRDAKLRR